MSHTPLLEDPFDRGWYLIAVRYGSPSDCGGRGLRGLIRWRGWYDLFLARTWPRWKVYQLIFFVGRLDVRGRRLTRGSSVAIFCGVDKAEETLGLGKRGQREICYWKFWSFSRARAMINSLMFCPVWNNMCQENHFVTLITLPLCIRNS